MSFFVYKGISILLLSRTSCCKNVNSWNRQTTSEAATTAIRPVPFLIDLICLATLVTFISVWKVYYHNASKQTGALYNIWSYSNHAVLQQYRFREALSYKCVKFIQIGVIVWECISLYGVGKLVIFDGTVDRKIYLNIIKEVITPEGKRLMREHFILQQDNFKIWC